MVDTNTPKKLYRSRSDRMVAGVAGGLADYFSIDTSVLRIIWVLAFLFAGTGFFLYLILWILVPEEPVADAK